MPPHFVGLASCCHCDLTIDFQFTYISGHYNLNVVIASGSLLQLLQLLQLVIITIITNAYHYYNYYYYYHSLTHCLLSRVTQVDKTQFSATTEVQAEMLMTRQLSLMTRTKCLDITQVLRPTALVQLDQHFLVCLKFSLVYSFLFIVCFNQVDTVTNKVQPQGALYKYLVTTVNNLNYGQLYLFLLNACCKRCYYMSFICNVS